MSKFLQKTAIRLIYLYISNIRKEHDKVKIEKVITHIDNTWFS